jgi:hypothetical protein
MALVLVATPKAANANAYLDRAAADAYFLGRLNAAKWTNATDAQKELALVAATNRLEQEEYSGVPTNSDQRLKWPRYGIERENGCFFESDIIPRLVQEAVCELALVLLQDGVLDRFLDSGLEQFEQANVGPLSIVIDKTYSAGQLPVMVSRMLGRFRSGGGGTVRLVRA